MKSELTQDWVTPPTWLKFFIIVVLVLGIFFRLVHLDRKVYWHDETLTSVTNSGYTWEEVSRAYLEGQVVSIEDLQKYQRTSPEKSVTDTVNSLATSYPEHAPVYYVTSRLWVQLFGNSVAATRSLPALLSLLTFPCMYWLCLELFASPIVAWIAIALLAVSPFHVLYAQEAREYSLWATTILLSSAALLRALRLETELRSAQSRVFIWGIYAATVALALYSYMFSILILIGHGIYVAVNERFKLNKRFTSYLLASLTGILAFIPWLLKILPFYSRAQDTLSWVNLKTPFLIIIQESINNLSYVFSDFWYIFTYYPHSSWNFKIGKYLVLLILILVGYSIYFLCRKSPLRVSFFVLTLVGVTALFLIVPDLIQGSYRSTQARYFTPCYIGIQLAVAYLLATQINPIFARDWRQKLWQLVIIALVSGGILSCAISSQAQTWWNKRTTSYDDLQATRIINHNNSSLLITEGGRAMGGTLTLTYMLEPNVRFQFLVRPMYRIPDNFSNVFLYLYTTSSQLPSDIRDTIEKEQNYKPKIVYKGRKKTLWKLEKQKL